MKKLGKNLNLVERTVEAYNCGCSCMCSCYGGGSSVEYTIGNSTAIQIGVNAETGN